MLQEGRQKKRSKIGQVKNRQGYVKNSIGNGEAKEQKKKKKKEGGRGRSRHSLSSRSLLTGALGPGKGSQEQNSNGPFFKYSIFNSEQNIKQQDYNTFTLFHKREARLGAHAPHMAHPLY